MKGDEGLENTKEKKKGFMSRHADGEADLKMPKFAKKILDKKGVKFVGNYFFIFLSFIIPAVMMALAFGALGIHGFSSEGDQQILVIDCWHQYFPFLQEMQDKMQSGGSLLYTLRSGLGTNFLAIMSYYTASPLNFLTVFLPTEYLREFFALFVCIKIGCAGMFMSIFLRGVFKRNDFSIVLFSVPYALSAYMMGYYWNVMWLDTVALAPLVFLGTYSLVKEGRYKTYVISLALAFFSNFYIGFFVCVFVAITFFASAIILKPGFKMFFKRLGQIALFTLIGLGITAALVLPAAIALSHAYSANSNFPTTFNFYETFTDVLAQTLAFNTPVKVEGLPNLYCGFLSVICFGLMIVCNKISIREKIVYIVVSAFLLVSCNLNVLDYIWHGFHNTNQIPFRFAFLFVFVMLFIGYRAFTQLDRAHWSMAIGAVLIFAAMLVIAKMAEVEDSQFKSNLFLGLGYLVCIIIAVFRFLNTKALAFIMLFPMLFELNANVTAGTTEVGSSSYSSYYVNGEDITKLVNKYGSGDDDFYRMETSKAYSINDPALYSYRGVSIFSSLINCETTQYARNLGILASPAGNRYYYAATTPFTNAVLNLKYTIVKSGVLLDDTYNKQIDSSGDVTLYENQAYLPLGFMCNNTIENMDVVSTIPFYYQNQLFSAMTGMSDKLFYYTPMTSSDGCVNLKVLGTDQNTGFHTYEPVTASGYKSVFTGTQPLNDTDSEVQGVAANTSFTIKPEDITGSVGKTLQITYEYMNEKTAWEKGSNLEFYCPSTPNDRRTVTDFNFEAGKAVMFPVEITQDIANTGLVIEGFGVRITNVCIVDTTADTAANTNQNATVSLQYKVTQGGEYYGCFKFNEIETITISSTNPNNADQTLSLKSSMPYACQLGYLNAGDTVTITGTTKEKLTSRSDFMSCVYRLDGNVFEKGISKLRSNGTLDVKSVSDTKIEGDITVNQSGIMYTSIPYEKGWSVYVDGEKQEAVPVCNNTYNESDGTTRHAGSMLGVKLEKGDHEITLKYSPEGFVPGAIISVICLGAFVAIIIINRKCKKAGKVIYDDILLPSERTEEDEEKLTRRKKQKTDDEMDFSNKAIKKK